MSKPFSVTFVPRNVAKFLVALAGLAGEALSLGLVPSADVKWVTGAVGLVTAVSVYLVPNSAPSTPPTPPTP